MAYSPQLRVLIDALRTLPGVGPKSAQRMAFFLLERDRDGAAALSQALATSLERIGQCEQCRMFAEAALCPICADPRREDSTLCVVESPADVMALDDSTGYRGKYFVLMGHLSPLDGIGPADLGMDQLERLLDTRSIDEVIIATNPTAEGDATANFIAELAKHRNLKVSRIAHGVPLGGELEYVDGGTLSHAFLGRRQLQFEVNE